MINLAADNQLRFDDLPVDWHIKTLADVASTTSGGTPDRKRSEYFGGSIPWVKSGELEDKCIDWTEETLTEVGLSHSSAKRFPSGTLLIALYGATAGKTGILKISAATNQAVCAIFTNCEINRDFLQFQLIARRREILKERYGGAQPNISQQVVRNLTVFLPPLPEQRRIAAVLNAIQEAIAAEDDVIAAARAFKRSLMQRLFTYGPGQEPAETKETLFGDVPASWETYPLGECAYVQTGIAKGRRYSPGEKTREVPYLRVANVQDGYLDLSEIKTIEIKPNEFDRYRLESGDMLMTEGGDFDKLGRGFIWNGEIGDCVHQNHVFAVRADQNRLMPEFLAYLSQSGYGKAYFLNVAHRTTNLASINSTKLKAFPLLLPPKKDQKIIVEHLRAVDDKLAAEEDRKTALQAFFKSMLHQLMTGQVRLL